MFNVALDTRELQFLIDLCKNEQSLQEYASTFKQTPIPKKDTLFLAKLITSLEYQKAEWQDDLTSIRTRLDTVESAVHILLQDVDDGK